MLSPEVLALRKGRITSSLAAACLGLDTRKTPIQAWLEIRGESTFEGNAQTERGNRLEGTIFEFGAERLGAYEWRVPPFVVHPETPWAGDSCDVTYHDDFGELIAIGEGKSVGPFAMADWGDEGSDQIPLRVQVQADWHLWHWPKAPFCAVPMVGGSDFIYRLYRVERNPARIQSLVESLRAWHFDFVLGNKPPPVTAADADTDYLNGLPSKYSATLAPVSVEMDSLVREIIHERETLKHQQAKVDLLRNQLRESLVDYAGAHGMDYSVSYRRNKDSEKINWQKLALSFSPSAAQIQAYSGIQKGPRVLRITSAKGDE